MWRCNWMKRLIYSILVVTITFITVVAMSTYNSNYMVETSNTILDVQEQYRGYEDAGYIFDDYGRQINIPIDTENNND
jgi:hypothetical protein